MKRCASSPGANSAPGVPMTQCGGYRASRWVWNERWSAGWEAQGLLRAVPVAGDEGLGERFTALIDPLRMWTITSAARAFFAAVTGVLLLGFTGSAYGDVGQPYLFQTIAAVVVGGTALVGGRGSYFGTIAGVLVLTACSGGASGARSAPRKWKAASRPRPAASAATRM